MPVLHPVILKFSPNPSWQLSKLKPVKKLQIATSCKWWPLPRTKCVAVAVPVPGPTISKSCMLKFIIGSAAPPEEAPKNIESPDVIVDIKTEPLNLLKFCHSVDP